MSEKLLDLAKTIRSKGAGPELVTFDIIFEDSDVYKKVKATKVINKKKIAEVFGIAPDTITSFAEFDPANAIKFTLQRETISGSPGDMDVHGAQQYPPLFEVEIPIEEEVMK